MQRIAAVAFTMAVAAIPAAKSPHASGLTPQVTPPLAQGEKNTRFDETFRKYSKRYFGIGYDWRRFKAQAMAESELNPDARSRVGAKGLMQLMPSTFNTIASKRPEFTSIDDPEWNIAAGIMHDRYLWKLWEPSVGEEQRPAFMYASYNAGEGTITRATAAARAAQLDGTSWASVVQVAASVPNWRYRETVGYLKRIEGFYAGLKR